MAAFATPEWIDTCAARAADVTVDSALDLTVEQAGETDLRTIVETHAAGILTGFRIPIEGGDLKCLPQAHAAHLSLIGQRHQPFELADAGATPWPLDEIVLKGFQQPRPRPIQCLTIAVEQSLRLSEW